MKISIDQKSGFCFGVTAAIEAAEDELSRSKELYCLGDLVHNSVEMSRLEKMGLKVISRKEMKELKNEKILIRAHGEPPSTYELARNNNLEVLDFTCPVVLKLQDRVKKAWLDADKIGGQLVIYGKPGHAEVIGLTGQSDNNALVLSSPEDVIKIDCSKPIVLFSQTTKDEKGFYDIADALKDCMTEKGLNPKISLKINNSICKLVSERVPQLQKFASEHDAILFVSGKKSSNGNYLFSVCKEINPDSYFISSDKEIDFQWFENAESIGICGATSTPMWLMEEIAEYIQINAERKT
ncbi:MAG: 4-hydroxy-3-methylbut-2-enyl diphosphate reductase [Marinilabiliales bacterium]|nr:MAG: 4-hydroxy-3-methylbut-2-enyl diphosphate reductase [Marinilabiliales bacterium]